MASIECAICLEALAPLERVRTLPCLHTYHADCIDCWFSSRHCGEYACPMCCTPISYEAVDKQ
jgi:hypothetical protein